MYVLVRVVRRAILPYRIIAVYYFQPYSYDAVACCDFIPESTAVATACKTHLTAIAWEHSDKPGKKIHPVNEQRIRLSMGRNGLTGITSCQVTAFVKWK